MSAPWEELLMRVERLQALTRRQQIEIQDLSLELRLLRAHLARLSPAAAPIDVDRARRNAIL